MGRKIPLPLTPIRTQQGFVMHKLRRRARYCKVTCEAVSSTVVQMLGLEVSKGPLWKATGPYGPPTYPLSIPYVPPKYRLRTTYVPLN